MILWGRRVAVWTWGHVSFPNNALLPRLFSRLGTLCNRKDEVPSPRAPWSSDPHWAPRAAEEASNMQWSERCACGMTSDDPSQYMCKPISMIPYMIKGYNPEKAYATFMTVLIWSLSVLWEQVNNVRGRELLLQECEGHPGKRWIPFPSKWCP